MGDESEKSATQDAPSGCFDEDGREGRASGMSFSRKAHSSAEGAQRLLSTPQRSRSSSSSCGITPSSLCRHASGPNQKPSYTELESFGVQAGKRQTLLFESDRARGDSTRRARAGCFLGHERFSGGHDGRCKKWGSTCPQAWKGRAEDGANAKTVKACTSCLKRCPHRHALLPRHSCCSARASCPRGL